MSRQRTAKSKNHLSKLKRNCPPAEDAELSSEEETELEVDETVAQSIKKIVQYFLANAHKKNPIKIVEIRKLIQDHTPSSQYDIVFNAACKTLADVYGLKVNSVIRGGKVTNYLVTNLLANIEINQRRSSQTASEKNSFGDTSDVLLILILTHVYMSGGLEDEEELYEFMRDLGIKEIDGTFGNVRNFVKYLVKQQYLLINAAIDNNKPVQWGERAEVEISKHDILKFVCDVYEDCVPENWLKQYALAEIQQKEMANNHIEICKKQDTQKVETKEK